MNTLSVIKYGNANAIEATWTDENGIVVKSTAYADVQMGLFMNDVAAFGGDINEHLSIIADVEAAIVPPAPPSVEELRAAFLSVVQQHIDSVASARGYDNGVSCASYFNDPHPPFNADAQAFVPWRSSVWLYCYAEWAKVEVGERTIISAEEFVNELPAAPW